jgi:hypothetical protein
MERAWALEYHLYEMRDDLDFLFLDSLREFDRLGTGDTGDTGRDTSFYVYPRGKRPPAESVPQRRGGIRYVHWPTAETIHFRPGGVHAASGALVAGQLARCVKPNDEGLRLYREFSRTVLGGFRNVGAFWLGPDAYRSFTAGQRLATIGIRSPRGYDLSPTGAGL